MALGDPPQGSRVILVDRGPLVALFDPKDRSHERCRRMLEGVRERLVTTVPVLTDVLQGETITILKRGRPMARWVRRSLVVEVGWGTAPPRTSPVTFAAFVASYRVTAMGTGRNAVARWDGDTTVNSQQSTANGVTLGPG